MCILVLYMTILLLSLTTQPLMNSALQPQGVFILLSVLSLVAFVVLYCFLGETMGLSKVEKKAIYVPGGEWGRKLKRDEMPYSPFVTATKSKMDYSRVPNVDGVNASRDPTFVSS